MPSRIHLLTVVAAGLALLAAAAVVFAHRVAPPTDAGVVPGNGRPGSNAAGSNAAESNATATGPATRSSADLGRSAPSHSVEVRPPAAINRRVDAGSSERPTELRLPTLSVTAAVQPVDVVGGELQVPDDPRTVGWWRAGATPGARTGSTVIDGHIDSAVAGIGALFHLADLGPGDQLSVRTASGRVLPYVVQARRVYVKSAGLPAELFDRSEPPRLVLISCGGTFDPGVHSYEENIVVFAVPKV